MNDHTDKVVSIIDNLRKVLSSFLNARQTGKTVDKNHEVWSVFQSLGKTFSESEAVRNHPDIKVNWSVGRGNWAKAVKLTSINGSAGVSLPVIWQ